MDIEIRTVSTEQDLESYNRIAHYSFNKSPDQSGQSKRLQQARFRDTSQIYILSKDGKDVATATIYHMTQNLRGSIIELAGVATVSTLPSARYEGHVSRLMQELFSYMKQSKIGLSILHPFRESFYHKFGYTSLPYRRFLDIDITTLRKVGLVTTEGSVEQYPMKEKLDEMYTFLEKIQKDTPGMFMYDRRKFDEFSLLNYWVAFAKTKGKVIGMMVYKITGYGGKMESPNMFYTNNNGKYLLLKFCSAHIDQVDQLEVGIPYGSKPELWVEDMDPIVRTKQGAMARVIDVRHLHGIPIGEGTVVIKIIDEHCEWNNGTWKFDAVNHILHVSASDEQPNLQLNISALSALVYGYYDVNSFESKQLSNQMSEEIKSQLMRLFTYDPHYVGEYF